MNAEERMIMGDIYECLNIMSGMSSKNPADLKRKAICLDRIINVVPGLMGAIFSLRIGESEEARDEALRVLHQLQEESGK
jgi:hypothetical protein